MSKTPWNQMTREERVAHNAKVERQMKVLAGFVVALILAVIVAITFGIRAHAPCWVFPLKEAPTRCLPGATP